MTKPKYANDRIDWTADRERLASLVEGAPYAGQALDVLDRYSDVSRQVRPRHARLRVAQEAFYAMVANSGLSLGWLISGEHPERPFREGNRQSFDLMMNLHFFPESDRRDAIAAATAAMRRALGTGEDIKQAICDDVRRTGNARLIARAEALSAA